MGEDYPYMGVVCFYRGNVIHLSNYKWNNHFLSLLSITSFV